MRSVRILVYVSLLLALIVTVVAMQRHQGPSELETYIAGRKFVLAEQARHAPQGLTLIVGDSIVEWAYIANACGAPAFNAGIMSAGLRDLAPLAIALTAILKPTSIILAIGTNDAAVGRAVPVVQWARDYEKLIVSLPKDRVELVAIPAVQPGKPASGAIDRSEISAKNRQLIAIAARHGLAFAPSVRFETDDGLHPTRAGATTWLANVETRCPSSSSHRQRQF